VHFDGKSKNYYVKRFTFEDTPVGKLTSIINEETGSKLVIISGASQPVVKVDMLKGKSLTPETTEINLADVIDVKGMKAQGNRLSPNEIKTIELIAEHDDPEDVPDPVADVSLEEIVLEEKLDAEAEKEIVQLDLSSEKIAVKDSEEEVEKDEEKPALVKKEDKKPAVAKEALSPRPAKKIDLEITNPDDIEIDDKGQLGLF
jgi:topoisomerase-4 subunit A